MKYALINADGTIAQACNDDTVSELPVGAIELTSDQFANWPAYRLVNGAITFLPPAPPAPTYQQQRAPLYPPVKDYMDGLVKGDTAQMQAYINACLAVKAKYPKPSGG